MHDDDDDDDDDNKIMFIRHRYKVTLIVSARKINNNIKIQQPHKMKKKLT